MELILWDILFVLYDHDMYVQSILFPLFPRIPHCLTGSSVSDLVWVIVRAKG